MGKKSPERKDVGGGTRNDDRGGTPKGEPVHGGAGKSAKCHGEERSEQSGAGG